MFRITVQTLSRTPFRQLHTSPAVFAHHHTRIVQIADWPAEKFDKHFIDYFDRQEIDGWELRKGMNELHCFDIIPDPKVIAAALRACRRINDFSLCVRFLESLKIKCGGKRARALIYPWLINEIKPVLEELGISTPEDLGYDKPELFIPEPEYWWEKKWYKEYGYHKMPGYEHFA